MGTTLNDTPSADRTHIAFFGRMNSGKSSLINALAGQQISIVSGVGGTTTDLVKKPMEIHGIGPCVLIDTAGFDDPTTLGASRIRLTQQAAQQADLAVIVCSPESAAAAEDGTEPLAEEKRWYDLLQKKNTPVVVVCNKTDLPAATSRLTDQIAAVFLTPPIQTSAVAKEGIAELRQALTAAAAGLQDAQRMITGDLVTSQDLVLLVMPQDIQAPKGRLILPQVQTLRELLDKKCLTMCTTTDQFEQALAVLAQPPRLIITDSQAFQTIYE